MNPYFEQYQCVIIGDSVSLKIYTLSYGLKKKNFNGSVYETFNNKCVIKFSILNIIQIPIRSDPNIIFKYYLSSKKKKTILPGIVINTVPFWLENFIPVLKPKWITLLFYIGPNSSSFQPDPPIPTCFSVFRPIHKFWPILINA